MSPEQLFDMDEPPELSRSEKKRARVEATILAGQHPLSLALQTSLPLHVNAVRAPMSREGPRCGGCVFRQPINHNAAAYPKCLIAPTERSRVYSGEVYTWNDYPRVSRGEGTDVRAWWPACHDFEATP